MRPFDTLYSRLAVVLFALVCLIGFAFLLVVRFSTQLYQEEVAQRLNRDLARHLVAEAPLLKGRDVNRAALEGVFHTLMVINPSIEVYLLDPQGRVLAYSAPEDRIQRRRVDLGPVRRFLGGEARYPERGVGGDEVDRLGRHFNAMAQRI